MHVVGISSLLPSLNVNVQSREVDPAQAFGDPGDASLDGFRGIVDGSQNGSRKQTLAPRRQRKPAQRVAGEAASFAIVR